MFAILNYGLYLKTKIYSSQFMRDLYKDMDETLFSKLFTELTNYQSPYRRDCSFKPQRLQRDLINIGSVFHPRSPCNDWGSSAMAALDRTLACDLPSYASSLYMLVDSLDSLSGKRVLQIGCNIALFLEFLINKYGVEGVGIDLNPKSVSVGQQAGLDLRCIDATSNMPDSLGTFDAIVAHHFLDLHYFNHDTAPLIECLVQSHRRLKPGGILVAGNSYTPTEVFMPTSFQKIVVYASGDCQQNYTLHK